jgi:thioredoxin-related protein
MKQNQLKFKILFVAFSLIFSIPLGAKKSQSVNWLTFEQLQDSLAINPKKVYIDFYTDWCTYCRKMDKVVYTKSDVINLLNGQYYAVKFNAETDSAITFGSQVFVNDQIGKSRKPMHQIAQLLASREGNFTPPAIVILDENFRVTKRYFEYLDSKKLIKAIQ